MISYYMANDTKSGKNRDELLYLRDLYLNEYEMLNAEINNYYMVKDYLDKTLDFLKNVDKLYKNNVWFPLFNLFVNAKIESIDKFLVYVGGNYSIEMSRDKAIAFFESRKKEVNEGLEMASKEKNELEKRLISIEEQLHGEGGV